MAYIESHEGLGRHPKTRRAARLLGVCAPQVVGHLQFLWWWCLSYAQEGDLSAYEPADIADAAGWEGDPDALIEALLTCGANGNPGFLERSDDGVLHVHDWWDYAGKLIERRQANAERMRKARAAHVPRTSDARAGANVTNRSVAERSEEEQESRETTATPEIVPDPADDLDGLVVETADALQVAPFIADTITAIEQAVKRSFALVRDFDPRDGPYLGERFAGWREYRHSPPSDWYQTWLTWVRNEARDQATARASPADAARPDEPPRPPPAYLQEWVPYSERTRA